MLFTGLAHAFFWVADKVVSAFPAADTSWVAPATDKVKDLVSFMQGLDAHLPITELFVMVGVFTTVWILWTVIVWVRKKYSLIAGGGGI